MNGTNSQWSYALQIGGLQTNQDYSLFLQYSQWTEGSKFVKNLLNFWIKIVKKETWEGVGKGSQRPNDPWAGLKTSGRRKSWFVDPPWDPPWGLIWGPNTTQNCCRRSFDQVANADSSKKWFLKDVLNEITSFGSSLDSQDPSKTIPNLHLDIQVCNIWCGL